MSIGAWQYPGTMELTHIVRNVITDPSLYRGMEFCPIVGVMSEEILVDVVEATTGLTQAHSLSADPQTVNLPGSSLQTYSTAYWKETFTIDERQMLFARKMGSLNDRAGYDLVTQRTLQMNTRVDTRIEQLRWSFVINNGINYKDPKNNINFVAKANIPDKNYIKAGKWDWTDPTHDILGDITSMVSLFRGTGGKAVKAYYSLGVAKLMAANQGIRDVLKQSVYALTLSQENIGKALSALFPGVEFEMYAEGYGEDKTKNFIPFIPDNCFMLRAAGAPGEMLMDFASTITTHNGGLANPQPGKFAMVEDFVQTKNPHLDITTGIYGLPRLYHPNWWAVAFVAPDNYDFGF